MSTLYLKNSNTNEEILFDIDFYIIQGTKDGFDILVEKINIEDKNVMGFLRKLMFVKHDFKFGNMATRETVLENLLRYINNN